MMDIGVENDEHQVMQSAPVQGVDAAMEMNGSSPHTGYSMESHPDVPYETFRLEHLVLDHRRAVFRGVFELF